MGHGLIQDPPSRNWFCGFLTKPDQVQNGVAQYPVCGNAFFAPGTNTTDGYSFMSVLTHTTGFEGIGPRENVCSFNSESFPGRIVPWDVPIDWPTVPMTAGPRNFVWSISWGPHFSDTSDFRYWITKPTFVWQTGRPLSFADFEDAPFCDLAYNDATPNANPAATRPTVTATWRCNSPVLASSTSVAQMREGGGTRRPSESPIRTAISHAMASPTGSAKPSTGLA